MVFRIILLLMVIFSVKYTGNGQDAEKKITLGIQTEFSFMPSYQYVWNSSAVEFIKPSTSQNYEIGLVSSWKWSNRCNFILGTEYRKVNRFSYGGKSNYTRLAVGNQLEVPDDRSWWYYENKTNSISVTMGLNYEIIKFSKFDIILHAAYGRNFLLKNTIDFEYIITEFRERDIDNRLESVMNERPPNYSITKKFNSIELGTGIKFNRFSYEILISTSDENLRGRKAHYGGRIRFMFL